MPSSFTCVVTMNPGELISRVGSSDFTGSLCCYTPQVDTHSVLTLLAHARPRRVLEVGTALGHMTANFTRWTIDDAQIFSMGIVRGMERYAPGASEQQVDVPTRGEFARFADHFGKAWKVFWITADSMVYDFGRLAPLDFVFIDGGHDLEHVLNDSRKAYDALAPGGWLVWHGSFRGHHTCAPCKGVDLQWVQFPPGNWVAPAGSYRSDEGRKRNRRSLRDKRVALAARRADRP